jgi:hypothetical protein
MWQAVVGTWLMAVVGGQIELNAPQNVSAQPDTANQPVWSSTEETPPARQPVNDPFSVYAPQQQPAKENYRPAPNDAADTSAAPSPALPKPIVTKQTYFSVPTHLDAPPSGGGQIVEIQMFVSHDRGAKWNFYNRTPPNQNRIPFRTAGDGEYWFAARSLDKAGKFQPQNVTEPTTIVVIDSKPPILLLSAEAGQGGQVTARWEISDPHLKTDSLSLQYRLASGGSWQRVAISDKDSSATETTLTGEASWWPTPGVQDIEVRAEISDAAGNKAVGHAQVKPGSGGNASSGVVNDDNASRPSKPVAAGANPRVGNQYQPGTISSNQRDPEMSYVPLGEKPRMVNSRTFELEYDLQSVGPSGVSRVELFGTRDGGRTWRSYGIDGDNRSPMTVRVEEEGIYGFEIVVTSGAGLGDPPPKSGDKPSIWIGVDLTRPTAKITSAEFGTGGNENKLLILWEANDKMPAEKPIALYFSAHPGGPWTPIATKMENTGRYYWPIDGSVPPLVYLRLEAVDEAGNRTLYDYPQPVPLDRSRPTGRIRDVRPA